MSGGCDREIGIRFLAIERQKVKTEETVFWPSLNSSAHPSCTGLNIPRENEEREN